MTRSDILFAIAFGFCSMLGWAIADHIQRVSTPTYPAVFIIGMFGFIAGRIWK